MATLEVPIKVVSENAIHNAIADVIRNIYIEHGIIVKSISADWSHAKIPGHPESRLNSIEISSVSEA